MKIFENADTLIPLYHIIAVAVFISDDRIPDSLVNLRIGQIGPLDGKLRLFTHNRHKIRCKGAGPSHGGCSHDKVKRHLDQSHILLCLNLFPGKNRIQNRQVWKASA